MSRRATKYLVPGLTLLGGLALISLAVGSRSIPLATTLQALQGVDLHSDAALIVRQLRLPRTLVALLAGGALGVAGALLQALARNPLAEPGLLGVNGGAALAVMIGVVLLDLSSADQFMWSAFAGAALAAVTVCLLGQVSRGEPLRLVLAGAGLSMVLASLMGILVFNTPPEVFDRFRLWAAGSLASSGLAGLGGPALAMGVGLFVALAIAPSLNALALGREVGAALGANLKVIWLMAFIAIVLLAGAATALAGPIAFIGLVAPHVARWLAGPDQRVLLPWAALIGAVLLLAADVFGRLVAAPEEIAAGIVTLLLGGPCFILLVARLRPVHA